MRTQGKRVLCDKSLTSVMDIKHILRVFPNARLICLYRSCIDTIASLLEGCQFGYYRYGVAPYVASSPHNLLEALGSYWVDRTEILLELEGRVDVETHRVKYEEMVQEPGKILRGVFEFIGVEWDDGTLKRPWKLNSTMEQINRMGDHKFPFTSEINGDSVGRGWRLPMEECSRQLIERINNCSAALGYRDLGQLGAPELGGTRSDNVSADAATIAQIFAARDGEFRGKGRQGQGPRQLAIHVVDLDQIWNIDLDNGQAGLGVEGCECGFVTDSQTLTTIARGQTNAGEARNQGRLRFVAAPESAMQFDKPEIEAAYLRALMDFLLQRVPPFQEPRFADGSHNAAARVALAPMVL
jgi:hypothetical protein